MKKNSRVNYVISNLLGDLKNIKYKNIKKEKRNYG